MHQGNLGLPMSQRYSGESDLPRPGAEAEVTAIFAPRIYLADPDPLTRALLAEYLREKGFEVVATPDMEASPPPVDVLIVALDGLEQRANRPKWLLEKPDISMIVLDRSHVFPGRAAVLGYAPDARLSLPVQPRKLVATIRQVLSLARIEAVDPSEASVRIYRFSGWTLHCNARRLESPDGKSILLDKRDFEVLKALLTFPRQVLTRQQLIALVWGPNKDVENRTLDRPIMRLRRHLGDDVRFPALLKTVVGVGYRLDVEVEKSL
jgi:two-component system OmpR family response regulator